DFDEIEKALSFAQESDRPVFIDCKTVIGFGATGKSGTPACHGAPLGAMEIEAMRRTLEWPYEPFEVPAEILQVWRLAGYRNEGARRQWEDRVARDKNKNDFEQMISGKLPTDFDEQMVAFEQKLIQQLKPMASRKSSQTVLSELVRIVPNLVGGSADLTAANYTNTPDSVPVTHYNYAGNYINYGIREHAMGAIMNGLAAHGGFIPYGGTFLSFSDYMKPAIRLAALMRLHVLYVFTHDSIGVGEDGPTHQPVEQLVSLRAVPNLYVFRPADTIETAECYACALRYEGPSALVFSRQELPVLRTIAGENQSAKGAYVLYEPARARDITLIATGSEVGLAMATKDILEKNGLHVAVVSMPCMELFARQSDKYRHAVLGQAPRMSIEAASSIGWDRWVGDDGVSIGLDDFGVSAPAKELFSHFGFIPEALAERAMRLLK
ncbi:MAG: transketolase-like TK C-terminal-containing protein, partial [Alphaproteobacteria bacterium]